MRRGRLASVAAAVAIAAIAAVAAVAAVSAGSGGGGSVALDPVAAAATKTQHAGAARIRFAVDFASPKLKGGKTFALQGAGAVDGTSGEMTFDVGSLVRSIGIPPAAVPGAIAAQLEHGKLQTVFLPQNGDYVLYARLGSLASQLPGSGGKSWIELNLSKLGRTSGLDLGQLMSLGSGLTPGKLLAMLKAEGGKVDNLGSATVDGVATTHYRVTIDVAKALRATGATAPKLGKAAAKLPTVPADVWIGKDGLVRRVHVAFEAPAASKPNSETAGRVAVTTDIYDYGAHVTIAPPPGSDVYDVTSLVSQLHANSGTK